MRQCGDDEQGCPRLNQIGIWIACCAMAFLTACKPGDVNMRDKDEAAVRAVEQAYDASWNAGDVEALVALLWPDATIVTPYGNVARGRSEIQRLLQQFLAGPGRGSRHTSLVWGVEFVTDDVAVVDAEARIEGLSGPDASQSSIVHKFTDILARKDGVWKIAHVRAYVFSTPPPNRSAQN